MRFAAVIAFLYALFAAALYFAQRRLMYRPQKEVYSPHKDKSPRNLLPVQMQTEDGLTLTSWYAKPRKTAKGEYFPTVFYFHGNTGIVANAAHKMIALADAGFGVFMVEYRGYGGNAGKPTEEGLLKDARAARAFVLNDLGENARLVYYGMSMGTGVANDLAFVNPPDAFVQEAGFTTFYDAGRVEYPYMPLPLSLLMRDKFESVKKIKTMTCPLLVLHGAKDATVPVAQAGEIFKAAGSSKKEIIVYPEGHHVDLYDSGSTDAVLKFLYDVFPDTKEAHE